MGWIFKWRLVMLAECVDRNPETTCVQKDCLLKKLLMKFLGDTKKLRTHKIIHDAMKIILSSDLIWQKVQFGCTFEQLANSSLLSWKRLMIKALICDLTKNFTVSTSKYLKTRIKIKAAALLKKTLFKKLNLKNIKSI